MKTTYDAEADAFYARFAPAGVAISATKEVAPGVMIDVDASGQIVGIELLDITIRVPGLTVTQ